MARAVRALPVSRAVIDGELVIPDSQGSGFPGAPEAGPPLACPRHPARRGGVPGGVLRVRPAGLRGPRSSRAPADGAEANPPDAASAPGTDRFVDHFERDGVALMQHVGGLGLEGIVGKKADTPYKEAAPPIGSRSGWSRRRNSRWSASPNPEEAAAASARCS